MAIINEHFPNTNSLISELMYQNPDLVITPSKPSAEEGAPLMKAALNYGFDKSDALVENRVALFDMLFAGVCFVEVDHILPENERTGMKVLPSEEELEQRKPLFQKVRDKLVGRAKDEKKAEINLEKSRPPDEESYSTNEGTFVRRWDPLNCPLDWRAERVKDCRYRLKKIWMSKAEFDAKYPQHNKDVTVLDRYFPFSRHKVQLQHQHGAGL